MRPADPLRAARAERLRGYFDLQLRFARAIADARALPLAEAVGFYTNFHRRFGLGAIEAQPGPDAWRRYVERLLLCETHEQRVDWTQAFFVQAPEETLPPGQRQFGCFSCAPPNESGLLRFHFANRDNTDGTGPLAGSKIDRRTRELTAMFAFVREAFPSARAVGGLSWLYHLDAYRRLFPAEFGCSRKLPDRPLRLNGTSSWGQFLDRRESIKVVLRDAFLRNLESLDIERPWRSFPLPALRTEAPIDVFYAHYGVDRR